MIEHASDLVMRHCGACGEGHALSAQSADVLLSQLNAWEIIEGKWVKTYAFSGHGQTVAFVNRLAPISHREDHHPGLVVNYGKCDVRYDTQSACGLTENDLICPATANALLKL